jgi:CRP/FNR family transcriptional regulator, anaerobic regulatory protein
VACQDCGLDPLCQVLEYGEQDGEAVSAILQRRQPIQRGALLFSTNQSFFAVFAVKSGSFKAVSLDFTGKERVVGLFLPGDLIGVEGIANQVYLYAVRALEESSVCRLEIDHLAQSGRSTEKLQDALIRLLGHEIVMNRIVTTSLIQQNAEQRLSAFLLSISKRYGLRGLPELQFELRMSRSDIGSYLGLARETVSRVLNKFQKSGLIGLRNHVVRVLNREGLEKVTAVRMKLP